MGINGAEETYTGTPHKERKLREVDVLEQQGQTVREAVKRIGVPDHTYNV